ncbi:putative Oxidoreductase domain protein [Candidatus Terasakiella magnetica]|nr:putative Oxidoreductase domain protein [Candidatus Terasakiella magnetica]
MIGVLGLGSIGLRHARNALALGREVMGCDPSPERRALLAAEGGRVTADRADLLGSVNGVVIATPSDRHEDDLAAAIAAGCHALVEKPIGHRVGCLPEILAEAEAQAVTVAAALNLRLHPAVSRAKAVLDEGGLGTPLWAAFTAALYLPDWRPGQDWRQGYANDPRTGGAIFDYIHEFDLACHLLGEAEALACAARCSGTLGLESEDMADAILRHADGCHSTIHVDYVTRPRLRVFQISGTGGRIEADLDRRTFRHLDPTGAIVEDLSFPGSYGDDYITEMEAFLACMGGAEPVCGGAEALAVLRTVLSARSLAGLPS